MEKKAYKIYLFIVTIIIIINLLSIFNLSFFGIRVFRIASGSMKPYLKVNDIIVIKKANDYKENDIITYKIDKNIYITHRIIKIKGDEIITKGDSNNKADNTIKKKNVIGKLVFKITGLGFIINWLSKPFNWVLLFVIGTIITIFIPDKKKK